MGTSGWMPQNSEPLTPLTRACINGTPIPIKDKYAPSLEDNAEISTRQCHFPYTRPPLPLGCQACTSPLAENGMTQAERAGGTGRRHETEF